MADETSNSTGESDETQPRRGRGRGRERDAKPTPTDPSKLKFRSLIPAKTNIDFLGTKKFFIAISLFLIVLSIGFMIYNRVSTGSALNYGIDFQGGSSVRIALTEPADIESLRTVLDDAGYSGSSVVAVPDAENEVLIRVKDVLAISEDEIAACRVALERGLPEGVILLDKGFSHPPDSSKIFMKFSAQPAYQDIERLLSGAGCEGSASAGTGKPEEFPVEYALIGVGNDIAKVIEQALGQGSVDSIVASETVGAKVGNQLKLDGVKATVFAIAFIFLYVMIRFDLRFAPGGIIALAHDAFIMVGAFAITGKEFNLQSIAAILTIVGYSINDTIVVFDRIRERVALFRDDPIEKTTNTSLNETLSRTLLTSGTTLLVVIATFVIGTGPIKDFAFALMIGLVAGTYSSLYIAAPVFLWVNDRLYAGKGHLLNVDRDAREGTGTLLGEDQGKGEGKGEGEGEGDESAPAPKALDVEALAEPQGVGAAGQAESEGDDDEPGPDAGERKTRRRRRRPQG